MKRSTKAFLISAAAAGIYGAVNGKGPFNKLRFRDQHEHIANYVETHYPGEDTQYDYFKAAINRQFSNYKWLRSPYYSHSYAFCCIYDAGSSGGNNAGNSTGVAFGFCI